MQIPAQLESPTVSVSSRRVFIQSIGNTTSGQREDEYRLRHAQASNSRATVGEFMYAMPSLR
jgi:hypothetical protein